MNIFIKSIGCVLISLIVYIILQRQAKDFSIILTLSVCVMVAVGAIHLLSPVFELFEKLLNVGKIDRNLMQILLKSVGISLLSEITTLICTDAGNAAVGKMLQLLATISILVISMPIFDGLIDLLNTLLLTS